MIVDVISGFLGAGKTTLIKKLVEEGYKDDKIALIENEFGEVGIDSEFLEDAGIEIKEMNAGCICCSIVGDFSDALVEVAGNYDLDRILIEPSGVGKLSDVIKAIQKIDGMELGVQACVIDVKKFKMYMKNFKEFYEDQIVNAKTIILSRTQMVDDAKVQEVMKSIQELNKDAHIITSDWAKIDGKDLLDAMKKNGQDFSDMLIEPEHQCGCGHNHEHEHEHECGCGNNHEHEHDHECGCGNNHEHDHECGCGNNHEHEHNHECGCGNNHEHEHDHECGCGNNHEHEHNHECGCGHDHHHDHNHHHADDVFKSIGWETARKYTYEELHSMLEQLSEDESYAGVLRCKGLVDSNGNDWLYFDYTPQEFEIRKGKVQTTGKIVVIGSAVNEDAVRVLFES